MKNDKMNLALADVNGSVLGNFKTLPSAPTAHTVRRPNFMAAARPDTADPLYEYFCKKMHDNGIERVEREFSVPI